MKTLHPRPLTRTAAVLFLAALASISTSAQARMIISMQEVGSDVVVTASGSVNTAGLSYLGTVSQTAESDPNFAYLLIVNATGGRTFSSISGPTSFGTGLNTIATSSSGDSFGLSGSDGFLYLPTVYASGSPLSATMTFLGKTLATLGTTVGTYTWTWGSGANADSATLYLGVPVPSIVNAELANTAIFGQSYVAGASCGFPGECNAGVFSFTATFCNTNTTGGATLVGLTSRTSSLSAIGRLVSRDADGSPVAGGAGSEQDFVSGTLAPQVCEDITYQIGLSSRARFSFYVDVYGNSVQTPP